ncbi:helix-turn-helix domain-containing protein [uncultured Tessaracoccus sp.]|uniref:helix-turn-helix domain-containing protein n=1 Tax=uncultured Tessaracoccus sp. TaxID=905023 RepID=UPI002606FA49|nr:helix-turn-helix domain-containing protein [uncultured Tessaracoccus sp.]
MGGETMKDGIVGGVSRSADPKSIRFWNEQLVLDVMRNQDEPLRIAELAELTGLTPASLGHLLRGLEAKGWVAAAGSQERRRGRPPQLFSLVRPQGCVLGIDFDAHTSRIVSIDMLGTELGRAEIPVDEHVDDDYRAISRRLLDEVLREGNGPVWAVGVSLDDDQHRTPGSDAASKVDEQISAVRDELRARGSHDDIIEVCDGHAAAFAAQRVDMESRGHAMLYVHFDRTPKLCAVTEHGVYVGARGRAGHVYERGIPSATYSLGKPQLPVEQADNQASVLIEQAVAGDGDALSAVQAYLAEAAPKIGCAAALMDPAVVVVGGALSPLRDTVLPVVKEAVEQETGHPANVVDSGTDEFGVAAGSAFMAWQKIFNLLISPDAGAQEFSAEQVHKLWAEQAG